MENDFTSLYNLNQAKTIGNEFIVEDSQVEVTNLDSRELNKDFSLDEVKTAINGNMGWENCSIRKKIEILCIWNILVTMDEARLCKIIFNWDFDKGVNNWCICVKYIFTECNQKEWYDRK